MNHLHSGLQHKQGICIFCPQVSFKRQKLINSICIIVTMKSITQSLAKERAGLPFPSLWESPLGDYLWIQSQIDSPFSSPIICLKSFLILHRFLFRTWISHTVFFSWGVNHLSLVPLTLPCFQLFFKLSVTPSFLISLHFLPGHLPPVPPTSMGASSGFTHSNCHETSSVAPLNEILCFLD